MPFGAFDPETVELLSAVLAAASAELEKDRPRYSKAVKTELTRVLTRNCSARPKPANAIHKN